MGRGINTISRNWIRSKFRSRCLFFRGTSRLRRRSLEPVVAVPVQQYGAVDRCVLYSFVVPAYLARHAGYKTKGNFSFINYFIRRASASGPVFPADDLRFVLLPYVAAEYRYR